MVRKMIEVGRVYQKERSITDSDGATEKGKKEK